MKWALLVGRTVRPLSEALKGIPSTGCTGTNPFGMHPKERTVDPNAWLNVPNPWGWIVLIVALLVLVYAIVAVTYYSRRQASQGATAGSPSRGSSPAQYGYQALMSPGRRIRKWFAAQRQESEARKREKVHQRQLRLEAEQLAQQLRGAFGITLGDSHWARVSKAFTVLRLQAIACRELFSLQEESRHSKDPTDQEKVDAQVLPAKDSFRRLYRLARDAGLVDPDRDTFDDYIGPIALQDYLIPQPTRPRITSKA